ncbi:unnamed protein product [Ostreobium quekettii]|uniref:Uncharacterized protein n=1 Tax=Ostreobium quekettii TaxID=121088 RepID=A0A8S1J4G1_9CHLO|nr:unnamed protein product [Ostreobium quekettii]|eukprot:evm.model.scf_1169.2 EVM.evm.TU.scf_1169.2   scf_1169:36427-38471(-)
MAARAREQRTGELGGRMAEELASCGPSGSCCGGCGGASSVQCLICLRRGVRPAPTFCGPACYREHWKSHRRSGADERSPSSSPELKPSSPLSQPSPPSHAFVPIHSAPPASASPLHQPMDSKHLQPQVPSGHTRHLSRGSISWGNGYWQGAPGTCHPTQWYPDGKWGPVPGVVSFPRVVAQEQVVGPVAGWNGYGPSRYVDPHFKYWGNY